jgi:hypothetical protein
MAKTWFVGARRATLPPTGAGDRVFPLSAVAQSLLPGGGDLSVDLGRLEALSSARVFPELATFVNALDDRLSAPPWFHYHGCDLSPAFRRPDEAIAGFANQITAFEVAAASAPAGSGPAEAWGADHFQVAGLRAALGPGVAASLDDARPRRRLSWPGRLPRTDSPRMRQCDILYLSLEPHVAQQQDRLLSLLSERYRIAAVALQRSSWSWPDGTQFTVRDHPALVSYLNPIDIFRALGGWLSRGSRGNARSLQPDWMVARDCARWLRSTWLRAAGVSDGLARAIERHRPRLVIGTNLASGMGTVMCNQAARQGVPVLSLPSGADYLLPPQFEPGDVGATSFVVPGELIASRLRQVGVAGEKLLACGWPEFDSIGQVHPDELERLRKEHDFHPERPLVVFFSSPSSANDELVLPAQVKRRALAALSQACTQQGLQLAVKLHPRERDGVIEQLAAELPERPIICPDRLAVLLQAADVVASVGSAITFAGAVLGKVTIILEPNHIGPVASIYRSMGIGLQPSSPEELAAILAKVRPGATAAGDHGLLGADGRVAERISAAVDRLLK